MKKLLIILAALSLSANAQLVTSAGTISNLSVIESSVCVCDSVTISFKFEESNNTSDGVKFKIQANVGGETRLMTELVYSQIMAMSYTVTGFDVYYSFKLKISCGALNGLSSPTIFNFNLGNNKYDILLVKDCTVGIDEINMDELKPIYYDLTGNIVEPVQGELLIKQVGNKRTKILIQ